MTTRPRPALVAATAVLAAALLPALAAPPAAAVTCDGGSGCVAISSAQDLLGRMAGGPVGILGAGSSGSASPGSASSGPADGDPVVASTTVTAFAQVERVPGEYSVGGRLAPESATGPLRIRVLHFPLAGGPGLLPTDELPYAPTDQELRDAWTADDLAEFSGAVVLDETAPAGALVPFRPSASGLFVVVATYPGDPVTTPGIGLHRFVHHVPLPPECVDGGTGPGGVPIVVCTS